MLILLMIIVMIVVVSSVVTETKALHNIDKRVNQNWEYMKEHYRKEGLDLK